MGLQLYEKRNSDAVFSCEFWEISKNTFSYRTPPVAASVKNVIGLTMFYLSPVFFYWTFLVYFISTEKWSKQGKYPDGVQIFTFFWNIYLSDVKNFKKNVGSGNLIRKSVNENLMLQFSWLEEFRWGKFSGWWTLDELQYENGSNDQL